jgi:hypothetical protein
MSSGLPGSKLIVYELPRPGFRSLALASEGRESKLLFHQRNKKAVAARTQDRAARHHFLFAFSRTLQGGVGFNRPLRHAPSGVS